MKRLVLFLAIFLSVNSRTLLAQATQTIVTGTVDGATSGYVEFRITPASSSVLYFVRSTIVVAPQTSRCGITVTGAIKALDLVSNCLVWGNDVLSPANSLYTLVLAPANTPANTVARLLITGASYDLTNPVFAPAVNFTPQYTTLFANPIGANIVPSAPGVFNVGTAQLPFGAGYINQLFTNAFNPSTINTTTLTATTASINGHQACASGADFGVKLTNAAALLPSTGGIVDCSNLQGAQTIAASDPFTGVTKPILLIWPTGTASSSISISIPATMTIDFPEGGILSMAAATTATVNGEVRGTASQHFAGSGSVLLNASTAIYPQWFAGSNAGAQIANAMLALQTNGGVVDGRGLEGAQTISSSITVPAMVQLLLGAATYTYTSNPAFAISGSAASILGINPAATVLQASGQVGGITVASTVTNTNLGGFTLVGAGTGSTVGILYTNAPNNLLSNAVVKSFGYGVRYSPGANSSYLNSIRDSQIGLNNNTNIDAQSASNALTLYNVTFGGMPAGIGLNVVDSEGVQVYGGDCEGVSVACINIDAPSGSLFNGFVFSGIDFEGNTGGLGEIVIGKTNAINGVLIQGNNFHGTGVGASYPVDLVKANHVTMMNNVVTSGYAVGSNPNLGTTTNITSIGNRWDSSTGYFTFTNNLRVGGGITTAPSAGVVAEFIATTGGSEAARFTGYNIGDGWITFNDGYNNTIRGYEGYGDLCAGGLITEMCHRSQGGQNFSYSGGAVGIHLIAGTGHVAFGTTVSVGGFTGGTAAHVCYDATALNPNTLATCTSLEELKDSIQPVDAATKLLMRLKPIQFRFRPSSDRVQLEDQPIQYGLGAHQVNEVDPKLSTFYEGKLNGVNFDGVTALLVKTVQEQQAEIDKLKKRRKFLRIF